MKLSNQAYDRLKFIALVVLPAFAVLYVGLGDLWNLPDPTKVSGSIILLDTFLGVLLQLNTAQYKADGGGDGGEVAGYLDSDGVDDDTGIPNLKLTITKDPSEILDGDKLTLKVGPPPMGPK